MAMSISRTNNRGFAGTLAAWFVDSKLTPIIIFGSILVGTAATLMLPREEEPQIKVPMIDVLVQMPGSSTEEVEQRVTRPMEKLLWEIPGVEYIYSTSSPGASLAVVRFFVGTDMEEALVLLNQKLQTNFDRIPLGVTQPLVKPRSIDDVPILALTFHGQEQDHFNLRRLAAQVEDYIKQVPNVAETTIIGGTRRQIRIQVDPIRLASRKLALSDLGTILDDSNRESRAGRITSGNEEWIVETGSFFPDTEAVANLVVGIFEERPVYLKDVATILDGPEEPDNYVFFGSGGGGRLEPAVTLSIAKRPGANAISVVNQVMEKIEDLRGIIIPNQIEVTVTRDYGETAAEKSNELLLHMGIAVFSVAFLIMFFLGWRESLVVLLAIPATLGLTLAVFYLYGYTLNRITLFALIFSIGILVDDAIVVVENMVRHVNLPGSQRKSLVQIAIESVAEVGNPTVLATWAVIAAILPMAFVGGLMGPYMRPIPVGASAAMVFSLLVAFIVTPWAAVRLLYWKRDRSATRHHNGDSGAKEDWFTRLYRRFMDMMIHRVAARWVFLVSIVMMLLTSMALVATGWVKVKMLPFDNKSEFQIILDMPEGTSLETTTQVASEMARAIQYEPEVRNFQIYAGTAAPFNFNGLVRHYFMRQGDHMADIQVNLVAKHHRSEQSHDIALRIRPLVAEIAEQHGAAIAIAEVPPGPPVLQTLVAEVYGPTNEDRLRLAKAVKSVFENTEGVVDIDWYVEHPQQVVRFEVDKEKAAFHGLRTRDIQELIEQAVNGQPVSLLHDPQEREDVLLFLELPQAYRGHPEDILSLQMRSEQDALVQLRELVEPVYKQSEQNLYHKNLQPVVYVTADVAGVAESPAYAILAMNQKLRELQAGDFGGESGGVDIYNASLPSDPLKPAIKWDGEWHITIEVFRDLGLAFIAVLVLIYMLMVGWFKSFVIPFIVMAAIPFSLIGILPAHGAMGAFFTATSMIGFMAGAGIVVRNSIILVDFIQLRLREGSPLDQAVVDAGAIRFRPMLLTALAVVVAAAVILADPIFQGLAIALMAGEIASLLISRMAVPILFYMHAKAEQPGSKS